MFFVTWCERRGSNLQRTKTSLVLFLLLTPGCKLISSVNQQTTRSRRPADCTAAPTHLHQILVFASLRTVVFFLCATCLNLFILVDLNIVASLDATRFFNRTSAYCKTSRPRFHVKPVLFLSLFFFFLFVLFAFAAAPRTPGGRSLKSVQS